MIDIPDENAAMRTITVIVEADGGPSVAMDPIVSALASFSPSLGFHRSVRRCVRTLGVVSRSPMVTRKWTVCSPPIGTVAAVASGRRLVLHFRTLFIKLTAQRRSNIGRRVYIIIIIIISS
jgi:hypothetical protein